MIKNGSGDLRRLVGIRSLTVSRGICGRDTHERINGRSVGGPPEDIAWHADSAGVSRYECSQKQNKLHYGIKIAPEVLNCNRRFYSRVWIIIHKFKIFVFEIMNILYGGIELHNRQGTGLACQEQFGLFEMVCVQVQVTEGVDECARL